MAYGRYDRDLRFVNAPGYDFFVEGPEFFHGSTASARNDRIDIRIVFTQIPDRIRDLLRRSRTLYQDRVHQHIHAVVFLLYDFQNIPNGRSCLRSDYGHLVRKGRDQFFMFLIEQSFFRKLLLQFLECYGKLALTCFFQIRHVERIASAALIQIDVSAGDDFHSFLQCTADLHCPVRW